MDKPSSIFPIPKRVDLVTGAERWPAQFSVVREGSEVLCPARLESDLPGGQGRPATLRLTSGDVKPEGYELSFEPSELRVSAADEAGFRHAFETLRQLATESVWPIGTIKDWPDIPCRGFHLNFANCGRIGITEAIEIVRAAARFKLNTLLVEYGGRFPFEGEPFPPQPNVLSKQGVERLQDEAASLGIRLVPLQQCMAHLEYALSHDGLSHLRERPDKFNLLCPTNPDSLTFFKTLAGQMMSLQPEGAWFHIGGDEARKIGHCERCQSAISVDRIGTVIGRYLGDVCRWVIDQGRRPIVWDDTLCTFPEALECLPSEAIIAYWDYIAVADPTPVLIPRMVRAEGGPRVAHDWAWTVGSRQRQLSDIQRDVMSNYSQPVRLKAALRGGFAKTFGRYLGAGFPRWIRALPYLEYYRDRGHEVLLCPTGMGNGDSTDGLPNFARFEANIRTHAGRARQGAAAGMITTTWYNVPLEFLHHALALTAQNAW